MSLQLKTTAVVAVALGVFFYAVTHWIDLQSTLQLAGALLVLFALIVLTFDLWVYRPLNGLIRRARRRLGGHYERNDPYDRDETRELGYLINTLIAVFTAADDKEWVSQSIEADLVRLQAYNRQLMDVGELGKDMNTALPYMETVDRVLAREQGLPARRLRSLAAARRRHARLLARGRAGRPLPHALSRLLRLHLRLPGASGDRRRPARALQRPHLHPVPETMKAS